MAGMAQTTQPSIGTTTKNGIAATQSQLDSSLRHFTEPSFDPVEYLNDQLPPLTLSASQPHATRAPNSVNLADLSSRSQSLVSQLGTQNVRLSGNLTQLTEEILRSGGRLAYEVEVDEEGEQDPVPKLPNEPEFVAQIWRCDGMATPSVRIIDHVLVHFGVCTRTRK